jgi:hypothetical protein
MDALAQEATLSALRHKRNVLLRAFVINTLLLIVTLLITLTPFYTWVVSFWLSDPQQIASYTLLFITLWKIGGILLFLVPAIAVWWELSACAKATDTRT